MKNTAYAAFAAAILLVASSIHASAACTTNAALSAWGQNGSNGVLSNTGSPGAGPLGYDDSGIVGQILNPPAYDGNGIANIHGTADCSDDYARLSREIEDAQFSTAALSAALSTPVWLEPGENFSISGGLGFSDGATALGATGVLRLGTGLSGFAGGAFSTDNTDVWAGKIGLRAAW